MLWLIRKLATLAVFVALVWIILQLDYKGRPIKDYANEFFHAPLVQELTRQARGAVMGYVKKDLHQDKPAMEELSEEERKELDRVLEKESGK